MPHAHERKYLREHVRYYHDGRKMVVTGDISTTIPGTYTPDVARIIFFAKEAAKLLLEKHGVGSPVSGEEEQRAIKHVLNTLGSMKCGHDRFMTYYPLVKEELGFQLRDMGLFFPLADPKQEKPH